MKLVDKKLGQTPLEAIQELNVAGPATYAGRLDPMAEGLLIILEGEECKKKDEYLGLDKEYEFELLLGFETDTGDLLGLVSEQKIYTSVSDEQVQKVLREMLGRRKQNYPAYSSKPVSGKPLFTWAREGRLDEIEIPSREVEIFSIDFLGRREVAAPELLQQISRRISLVSGDFRQREVLESWQKALGDKVEEKFTSISCKIHASSGTYIRSVGPEIAERLGSKGCLFSLKRTRIGPYLLV